MSDSPPPPPGPGPHDPHQSGWGPPGGHPGPPMPPAPLRPDEERTWGTLAHLSALIGALLIGLFFLGPLLVMLVYGERSFFVRGHAVEALNFQLTMAIVTLALLVTCVGVWLIPLVWVFAVVFAIVGAVRANRGQPYQYPLTWRMVK